MCQYDPRCSTRRHRPRTVCPYLGRTPRSASATWAPSRSPAAKAPAAPPSGATAVNRTRDRAPQLYGGASVADFFLLLILLHLGDDAYTTADIFLVVLLIAVPCTLGWELLSKCRAWISDGSRRCEQPRKGFLQRCVDHRSQPFTAYDAAGALSLLIGCVNAAVKAFMLVL